MTHCVHNKVRTALLSMCLLLNFHASPGLAGKLDDFEKSATSNTGGRDSHNSGADPCDVGDCIGIGPFFEAIGIALAAGGMASLDRLPEWSADPNGSVRRMGEPLIPFIALEPAWQMLKSDVEGFDLQAEIGYGPLALHGRFTRYREEEPDDRMNFTRISFLYRMSIGSGFEIDLGLGTLFFDGDTEFSRFSFSLPMRMHPGGPVGLEFRPAWSKNLADYDVALYLTLNNVSLKGGYRWLNTPDESLNGPYVGLSLRL